MALRKTLRSRGDGNVGVDQANPLADRRLLHGEYTPEGAPARIFLALHGAQGARTGVQTKRNDTVPSGP